MTHASPPHDPPTPLAPRPLSDYALIIDARSPHEYAEDHVPGAVNLPVVDDDEYAQVGILHKDDPHAAYLLGAQYSLRNIADNVKTLIARFPAGERFLVYCFRGGKRSQAWAHPLRMIGYQVDIIPGGWKRYRAWVRDTLDTLPARLDWRVLCGPTLCGKTRLLHALEAEGGQVIDLEGLAAHRGSLLGGMPERPQPTQKNFDSALLAAMRRLDPARPIWIEAESKRIGRLQLPEALVQAMHRAPAVHLQAPLAERVRLGREEYAHFVADPLSMMARLDSLKPLVGGKELALWHELAAQGQVDRLVERLMVAHYDPCYARSTAHNYGPTAAGRELALSSLDPDGLARAARELLGDGV